MPSQTSDEQLSDALYQAVSNGAYPDDSTIVSTELPASAIDILLETLENAREDVKASIRELSRLSAPDIDGWISQARQLRADIDGSQNLAQEVVALAGDGQRLQAHAEDASGKVELLKGEIAFNEALSSTLQQVHDLRDTLDAAQHAALNNSLPDAIALLKNADRQLSELRGCENTRLAGLVRAKVADLHKLVAENLTEQWNALVHVDTDRSLVSFHKTTEGDPSTDIDAVVMALSALGLLRGKILLLRKAFDNVILTPRIQLQADGSTAAWTIQGDDIWISGRITEPSTKTLLSDIIAMVQHINSHIPPAIAIPFTELLLPGLASRMVSGPLSSSVPQDLDGISSFKHTLDQVSSFAESLVEHGLRGKNDLTRWVDAAPQVWLARRTESSLHSIRHLLVHGLGKPQTVERVETQVISSEDNLFVDNSNNEDWNAGWSDEDEENKSPKPAAEHSQQINGKDGDEEEDVSAWGLDDDADNEPHDTDHRPSNEEDDGGAWGWSEDNENNNTNRSPAAPRSTKKTSQRNGSITNGPLMERQVTLKESYHITSLPEQILELIIQVASDAEALAQSDPAENPVTPAAEGLFALPGLLLSMYRACAPSFYLHETSGNMFLYNDSLYMAEQLRLFAEHQVRRSAPNHSKLGLDIEPDVSALEVFGKRAYGKEMESQRTILGDLLDSAEGFANSTEQPFAQQCDLAISSTVDRLRELDKQWKPVLSRSALLQSIGSLLSTVINKIILEVEDLGDISEPESQRLTSYCNRIIALDDLFLPEQSAEPVEHAEQPLPRTAVYTAHWLKFQYLTNILESSLVDIKYLWTEAELSLEFEAEEVVDLIEALFADSEHRRRAIGEIRRSAKRT
ncbi:ribosome biogenesis protein ytm1 [Lambiella insularis]|nr:ribosome biogenesis protein ytm1 [Lambiella insularis]